MERTCVLVADRLRARLFAVEPGQNPRHRYDLEEKIDLINRYPQISYQNRGNSTRSEIVQRNGTRISSGYDHKQNDHENDDKKFAKEVIQELMAYLKAVHPEHLVLVAPPQFLGSLRVHKQILRSEVDEIHDLAKELAHLSIPEIRDYLEQKALF